MLMSKTEGKGGVRDGPVPSGTNDWGSRANGMNDELHHEIFEKFEKNGGLSAIPSVATTVPDLVASKEVPIERVASAIKQDPGFAMLIIHHASLASGLSPQTVKNVDQAVKMIGLQKIGALCLILPLFSSYRTVPGVREI